MAARNNLLCKEAHWPCKPAELFAEAPPRAVDGFPAYFEVVAACYHEAGHAAARYILRESPGAVEISGFGGISKPVSPQRIRSTVRIRRQAVLTAAGPLAEHRYRAEAGMPPAGCQTLTRDMHDLAIIGLLLDRRGQRHNAWRAAAALVDDERVWRAIAALAEELEGRLDEKWYALLDGRDVRRILRGAYHADRERAQASAGALRSEPWPQEVEE